MKNKEIPALYIIDSETMDRYDTSVILSLAILKVPDDVSPFALYDDFQTKNDDFIDPENYFYCKIERKEQIEMGRTIGKATIEWWESQSETAKDVLSNKDCLSVLDSWKGVIKFLKKTKFKTSDDIISRGMFESKLWEHFCEMLSKKYSQVFNPIQYYQYLDSRTMCKLLTCDGNAGIKENNYSKFSAHNALHDCFLDWLRLDKILGENDA